MRMQRVSGVLFVFAALSARAAIQTAGDLLVDVNASTLSALGNNATVAAWTNSGTLGGQFVPAVSGQGALYQTAVGGAPAVTFAASANSVMTNSVPPPSSILSNNIWSAELWVLNPILETSSSEDQLSWTDRGNWTGSADGTCMEIRYCFDTANAVEHYNSTCNIPWSGTPPQAGIWHHVVITRDTNGVERLYADGVLRTAKTPTVANLRGGGRFALGGVWDRASANWQMLFSGSLAAARVHSGTLSAAQVLNNYQSDRAAYQTIWNGAAGTALPWADPANWLGGNVGESGETVWIDNGGTAVLTNGVQLSYLFPAHGGLVITNGAALTFPAISTTVNVGDGAGKQFALTVAEGSFRLPGANLNNLYMGVNGGRADVTLGGSGADAVLDVDRDAVVGNGAGTIGRMTIGNGGAAYCSNGYFYVANSVGSDGQLDMSGGLVGFRTADRAFVVSANGGRGVVNVNGGTVDATGDIQWSAGASTNRAYGAVYLAGGTLRAKRLFAVNTAGTNLLYVNGGTLQARDTRADFMYNLTAAYLQSGGVTFDIPTNVTVTAAQGLLTDPVSLNGGVTKTGAGRLTLAGVNTFTGNINVNAGDLLFRNTGGFPSGYSGTITLTAGAAIGYEKAGGAAQLLSRLNAASAGYLTLFGVNAAENVDFSTFPNMNLSFIGVTNYTGTFTPYPGQYSFKVEGAVVTNAAVLADAGATPGHLSVTGSAGGGMVLSGNNTFTGGTEIDAAYVVLGHANALGTQATPGARDVLLRNGGTIRFDAAMDIAAFVTNRLMASSSGILLIGAANAGKGIDLSGHPGIVVGSGELSLDYSGTLVPAANVYRLGGGNAAYAGSSSRGLSVSNLADSAGLTAVAIGTPGIVELKAGNSYSGNTVVTNRGVLFLKEDGLGAVPAAPTAGNLLVDNGVIRSGPANFSLNANRGVTVGAGGMELHPWGGYTMTVGGNLAGSGKVTATDSGYVTFAGAANSYNGNVVIGGGQNIRIGSGPAFSWASTGGVTDNGTLWLKTDGTSSFADIVSGSGAVRKEGAGTLTLASLQTYAGVTYIDAGVLQVAATNVLPRGAGKGVVEIKGGAALDANNLHLMVGGLSGAGLVTNSAGGLRNLYVGENSVTSVYSGVIAPALALVKIGTGKQTLGSTNGTLAQASVQAGVLELAGPASVSGAMSVADGATLVISDAINGLAGEFFDLSVAPVSNNFVSLSTINTFLAGRTPALLVNSSYLGSGFDLGATGAGYTPHFPAAYNASAKENFVTRFAGWFNAEQAGTYTFATASDDGSLVFIDGATVVDNNKNQSYLPASKVSGGVTLTAGLHAIVIVMYEIAGDQGLTVWLTAPGGAEQVLPSRLLFSGNTGASQAAALTGSANSTLSFLTGSAAILRLTGDGDSTFAGAIQGTNANSRLVKEGSGKLTLTSTRSDFAGVLDVQKGSLRFQDGAGLLGVLNIASQAVAEVTGKTGLDARFYNNAAANADYTMFASVTAINTYLSGKTPDLVTNSLAFGANLDCGETGNAFPGPYSNATGSRKSNFDMYLSGKLYLDRTGLYAFGLRSDDGSMFFIDGVTAVNSSGDKGMTDIWGTRTLTNGFHDVVFAFRQNGGGYGLRVSMAYPGGATNLLPQSILYGGAQVRGLSGVAGGTLNLGAESPIELQQNADTTYGGTLLGGAKALVTKNGTGTLTLTDDNAGYAGGYLVNSGALRVGNGGLSGTLGPTASAAIAAAGTLIFNRAGTVTVGGTLSGTGLLRLDGPGEVYITSTNAFAGTVKVNSGRLTLAPGATLGASATITNAGVVEVKTSGTLAQSGVTGPLLGNGELNVTGSGTLLLNRDNVYTGVTRVSSGATLRVARPSQLGGGGSVALDGGTLAIMPEVTPGTNALLPSLGASAWRLNGAAIWSNRYGSAWVQLTPNSSSVAGSAFCNTKLNPAVPWYASFRYEVGDHMLNAADGITFILQNSSATNGALGASGGALGVDTISPSIGIFFNLYNAASVGWIVNGAKLDAVTALNGIIPTNGMDVALSYDGDKLNLTLTQGVKIYAVSRTVNMTTQFSGNTAYAGFTGGTGGATAQQFVGNFALTDALPGSTAFGNTVTVGDGLTGTVTPSLVISNAAFSVNGVSLGSNATLNVSAAAGSVANSAYLLAASNVTAAAGVATVNLAANGSGKGVLALAKLTFGSGAKLVVTGAVSVPGGVLTVVVPTPVPRGVTQLADFTGATWVGGQPTIVLRDAQGNILTEVIVLRNGLLYINTIQGTLLRLR